MTFPEGWQIPPFQPPSSPSKSQRFYGTRGRSGFASFPDLKPFGWEIPPPQPPRRIPNWRINRAAAIMPSEQGIELPYVFVPPPAPNPWGWEGQPSHLLPRFLPNAKAVSETGDQGIQFPLINFLPYGWELPPPQPRHPRPEAAGAIMPSEAGIEATFIFIPPPISVTWPWVQDVPLVRKKRVSFALTPERQHIEAPFTFQPWGWEIPSFQPPTWPKRDTAGSAISGSADFASFLFQPYGWEIPPFQPPHPRYEKSGLQISERQGSESPFVKWLNAGWEIPPFQPPHPRRERAGSIMPSEPGIESPFVFVPLTFFPEGWQIQPFQPPALQGRIDHFAALVRGGEGTEFPFLKFFPSGWEIAPPFLQQKISRYPALEGHADFIAPITYAEGWQIQTFQPPRYLPERAGAISFMGQGPEAPFVFVPPTAPFPYGWEIASFQPPNPSWKLDRFGATVRGQDGTDFPLIQFFPHGWPVQPFQPPHPRSEKSGAIMPWEQGIEAQFVFVPQFFYPEGWQVPPFQPPAPSLKLDRFAGVVRGQDGTEFPFINWRNAGWEIAPYQPPHPRPEKAGAIMPSEPGIEAKYVFIPPPFFTDAWEVQPWQPPHPRPERVGAIMRGDEGIQFPLIRFLANDWDTHPFQPPHRGQEWKGAALFKGDEGIQFRLIVPFVEGWQIPSFQPPHRGQEWRAATFFRGDEGIQWPLIIPFQEGWHIPPFQPPHPRPERFGSIVIGDQGNLGLYVFAPPIFVNTKYVTVVPFRNVVSLVPQRSTVAVTP